jgi:hypothetical protein
MNKIYPITAGIGVVLACAYDFFRTTLQDARSDRGIIRPKAKPTPVPEEDFETVVAPTG